MTTSKRLFVMQCAIVMVAAQSLFAQGYDDPLTIQGLDRHTLHSAASRAVGGTTIGVRNGIGLMFANPAALQTLTGVQFSIGGLQQSSSSEQVQQYAPLKYYSNFSLLMEGLTHLIPDPDTSQIGNTPGDTVQRPYDDIGPNWSRSKNRGLPLQAMLAVPFTLGEAKFVAGAGAVEYADLNQYYQNNNVLSPSILSQRPIPYPRPSGDSTIVTQWSQYYRARDGQIRGYGAALSGEISDLNISLGVSGMILKGTSDDFEQRVARGRLTFYANYFRLDSVYGRSVRTGTSDYSGQEFTFSGIYRGQYLSLGFSLRPPMTMTREFTTQVLTDSTGSAVLTTVNGEDKVRLPWRGTVGLAIVPGHNLMLGFEYELRPYSSTRYTDADGVESRPWLSSSMVRVGVEYTPLPWLAVRGGIRGRAEIFEPEGNPLPGEPVSHSIYSGGVGLSFAGIRLNVTYEYGLMKYEDVWGSAISLNKESRHTLIVELLSYEIPVLK